MHRRYLHSNKLPITVICFKAKLIYKNFKYYSEIINIYLEYRITKILIFYNLKMIKILIDIIVIFVHNIINKKKKVIFTTIT